MEVIYTPQLCKRPKLKLLVMFNVQVIKKNLKEHKTKTILGYKAPRGNTIFAIRKGWTLFDS